MLQAQLTDVNALRDDAEHRGWTSEAERHDRVARQLHRHLNTVSGPPPTCD